MTRQPINPEDILLRLNWTEDYDLEFKSGKGGVPHSLWETYSAMANTHGGVILLGVENDGTVSGVDHAGKVKKSLWDSLHNRNKVNINLLADGDVADIPHPDGTIVAVRVPQASRNQRPVYIGQNPLTGTYRRNYEGDYHCNEREVGRLLSDRSETPYDSFILEHFTLDDLDLVSLKQYRQRLASHKPNHPWLNEDDKELLSRLGGWRKDRVSGFDGLTVAGVLMFGTDEAIQEAVPQYHVDYRERLSSDPAMRWTDRLTVDGTWCANLFQFYLKTIQRLAQDLKLPFKLGSDLFRQGETVVHEAIREALVNALIHADYQGEGGIVIEKYTDRFEFSNPGSLLISLDQLFRGNVSECRNKSLQKMFMMIGTAEKAGSGIDKIRRGWNTQYWRTPSVRENMQPDRVQWLLPMTSLIPEESLERLHGLFGSRFAQFDQNEVQALVTADIEGEVDNLRVRQICTIHSADATHLLQGLVAIGALVRDGHGRWSRYQLPHTSDSLHNEGKFTHTETDSLHNEGKSTHNETDFLHNANDYLYNEELLSIVSAARNKKRLSPEVTAKIILELCQGRWLTRHQLSNLLERNSESLRERFLNPMVTKGLLKLRYPDKPNHTGQAYMATDLVEENDFSLTKPEAN
jgi:ATP-dependent DNA helicase RecG